MNRILFTSISFPPKRDSEGIQTAKYFSALQEIEDNLVYEVVTSAVPTLNMPYEKGLLSYDQGYSNKVELKIPESKYFNYILRKISPEVLQKPDSKFLFHKKFRTAIKNIFEEPDLIYSRSYPLSSAILGFKLAEYYEKPWVMHLSDPWTIYSLNTYSKKAKAWHAKWEKKCFEKASKVCFTSLETIKVYESLYPQMVSKFEYFPNVYERTAFIPQTFTWSKKLRIVYTGGLIGQRSLKWIVEPLQTLISQKPEVSHKLELVFCGEMDRFNSAYINNLNLPFLKYMGVLPYEESLKLQRTAHILLQIDNLSVKEEKSVFFPSKLLDYALAARKIFSITSENSAAERITSQLNGVSVRHENSSAIIDFLIESLKKFEGKEKHFFLNENLPEEYDSKYQAKKLSNLFVSLLSSASE